MGSGDMISEKLTGLMDAVRSKYALTDKLSLDQATGYIGKPDVGNIVEDNTNWSWNNGDCSNDNGVLHVTCGWDDNSGVTGFYQYYNHSIIKPGNRYNFTGLLRGNLLLHTIGEEQASITNVDKQLDPDKWMKLSFNFIAKSNIIIYGKAKKGDWMELKDWVFSELGG